MADELEKKYYKIKDVAELLDVNASTLRYWEKEFPECAPRRSATNIRYYDAKSIELLRIIRYLLKDKGLKIEAAKEQLKSNRKNVSRKIEVLERLEDVRNQLEGILSSLNKRR